MFGFGRKKYNSVTVEWKDQFDKGVSIVDTSKYYLDGNTVSFDNSNLVLYDCVRVLTYMNGERVQVLTL
jgi:hypothetical protein